ncbi:uncharacterized protein LOC144609936 [Rhinoraja longicauda]
MPAALQDYQHVCLRRDAHRAPLQWPYEGPFKVLQQGQTTFVQDIGGQRVSRSPQASSPGHRPSLARGPLERQGPSACAYACPDIYGHGHADRELLQPGCILLPLPFTRIYCSPLNNERRTCNSLKHSLTDKRDNESIEVHKTTSTITMSSEHKITITETIVNGLPAIRQQLDRVAETSTVTSAVKVYPSPSPGGPPRHDDGHRTISS